MKNLKKANHCFQYAVEKDEFLYHLFENLPKYYKNIGNLLTLARDNIRVYNSMLAFTSIGAEVDKSLMSGNGPYTYRIQGQIYHRLGSLLPLEGKPPKCGQLYIFDTQNEVQNRIGTMTRNSKSAKLDENIVEGLIRMLDENNSLAVEFRKARDKYESGNCEEFTIRLVGVTEKGRQYDLPMADEIAGLIVGKFTERDIIVQYKSSELQ
ncbi:hypothetical protein Bca4012_009788 [Brassica carinata]